MHLLLLHGALGSARQLEPLARAMKESFTVHTLDFTGHGGKAIPGQDFSIPLFANDVLAWMNRESIPLINIFGYSMGGYVALYIANHHPERVGRVVTLATKFNWTPDTAANEIKILDPAKIIEKLPAFAEALAKRHQPADWKQLLDKTAGLISALGGGGGLSQRELEAIRQKVLLCLGDSDKMVTLQETVAVQKQLSHGNLLVLPGTGHPIETVDLPILAMHLCAFLA